MKNLLNEGKDYYDQPIDPTNLPTLGFVERTRNTQTHKVLKEASNSKTNNQSKNLKNG